MAASNSGPISAEARAALGEAIRLVFARWTALQEAVENQWGGRDSCAKANQLGESILSWFCRKGPHFFEDLVDVMENKISESFHADLDDNSVIDIVADDGDISDDDDNASMMNDEAAAAEETAMDLNPAPHAAGWTVVPPRRRGRILVAGLIEF